MTANARVTATDDGGQAYLAAVSGLLAEVTERNAGALRAAGAAIAECLRSGGRVHAFGTGHSHMMAEELYYRAGGLAAVNPVLRDDLMLHLDAAHSTELERDESLGRALAAEQRIASGDVVVVASNSGGNGAVIGFATAARDAGATVIGVTSLAHAESAQARASDRKLHDIAHIVLDNGGVVGDAAIAVDPALPHVGPTSTVIGAALVNAMVVEAVTQSVRNGVLPEIYLSANVSGGDEHNTSMGGRHE